jgi:hypothetical protein
VKRQAPGADQPLRRQKIRDRALVLPLVGLVMLVPPFASIFQIDARIVGVPFAVLYLFGVWALLIVGGCILARELRVHLEGVDESREPDEHTIP